MKNLRVTPLVGVLACALSLGTTACEKVAPRDITPLAYDTDLLAGGGKLRIFNGVDNCARSGGNCLGDVVVVGHANLRAELDELFTGMSGNPKEVGKFFNGPDWKTYFPSLAEEDATAYLKRLQSGECDLQRIGNEQQMFYYAGAGSPTPQKNEMVMPIVYKD